MPPELEPLPEIPAAAGIAGDPELEPQVTITKKEGETVEEARVNGQAEVDQGHPASRQALLPDSGRRRATLRPARQPRSGLKVPLWLLFAF